MFFRSFFLSSSQFTDHTQDFPLAAVAGGVGAAVAVIVVIVVIVVIIRRTRKSTTTTTTTTNTTTNGTSGSCPMSGSSALFISRCNREYLTTLAALGTLISVIL